MLSSQWCVQGPETNRKPGLSSSQHLPLAVCSFKGQRWSSRISLPCCWWLLVHYMYLPMRADRCIARGETSSRLKVQLVLHAHVSSWTWVFFPFLCLTLQLSVVNITVSVFPSDIILPEADWHTADCWVSGHGYLYLCPLLHPFATKCRETAYAVFIHSCFHMSTFSPF